MEEELKNFEARLKEISKKLLDYGWPKDKINSLKSIPAAYLTGLTFGKSLKNEKFLNRMCRVKRCFVQKYF